MSNLEIGHFLSTSLNSTPLIQQNKSQHNTTQRHNVKAFPKKTFFGMRMSRSAGTAKAEVRRQELERWFKHVSSRRGVPYRVYVYLLIRVPFVHIYDCVVINLSHLLICVKLLIRRYPLAFIRWQYDPQVCSMDELRDSAAMHTFVKRAQILRLKPLAGGSY